MEHQIFQFHVMETYLRIYMLTCDNMVAGSNGNLLIDNIEIDIGGQIIDKHI